MALQPYFEDKSLNITIYHGDCAEIIPQLGNVDLVMTDPPYGIDEANGKNKSRGKLAVSKDYGVSNWDSKPIEQDLMDEIISKGEYACVWGGNYYTMKPSPSWLVWDKKNGKTDFADCELAWTNYGRAVRKIEHLWHGMLRKDKEKRMHPTQKPIDVIKWAIQLCPKQPKMILDPFGGSGTTGEAAIALGCGCILIEREEKYCEISANRMQPVLFSYFSEKE